MPKVCTKLHSNKCVAKYIAAESRNADNYATYVLSVINSTIVTRYVPPLKCVLSVKIKNAPKPRYEVH